MSVLDTASNIKSIRQIWFLISGDTLGGALDINDAYGEIIVTVQAFRIGGAGTCDIELQTSDAIGGPWDDVFAFDQVGATSVLQNKILNKQDLKRYIRINYDITGVATVVPNARIMYYPTLSPVPVP